ncbi:methyltransferase family protein [Myxococcus xanthus DK 1622]|uniref:Methyltransferase family protein n=1 Tax=Myxococcus xanthus (strain DK1622) TaxID=246197 RepID=Q1D1F4_MYXXD|nr:MULTISPECIES: class I SAM-dependent methyltransferase [Myxococcus]ABF87901.1 methyltransferase family protein [Myxococcus xanthus DK 1622]NOJ54763.1 class I SAM-dependent methyltransferase [Myxococcus xanthus]QPM77838.1 class I SAM-dependent methyltransferase [Myxococcus xanthus]QVW66906.1 class I SAM-dependent methyltransferase [Myxococcus xanthus DZ2]QZZ53025.1 Ubiquinone biosynthesis O-methyltransferase, mitochondrial [Myxococcus xanthus]
MSDLIEQALLRYDGLPVAERFHVHARAFSAPLLAMAARTPVGAVADIGCGHGLLSALLALEDPRRTVHGVDPDSRKVAWARRALAGQPNVRIEEGTVEETLAGGASGRFDAAVVCDVLYLLPEPKWPGFLSTVRDLLKPSGRLLLKEVEGDGSWKHRKALAQEWVMVSLLGRTKASGGMALKPRAEMTRYLKDAGFAVREVVDLGQGYTTPHVLYVAENSVP